jgi:hypothetical protein
MELANPLVLLLISPVALAGWYAIRKGIPRALIISRVIILSLLIIALASPFTLEMSTKRDIAPRITVLSDQTMSMDLFDKETGKKIFDAIHTKTITTPLKSFAGIKSPIGDEVINNAEGNNNIVLVSDGNNNHGKDLFDAISFVSRTGTKVFAVKQKPIRNDASVEIESAKNLIIGNENVFNIVVRQAGNETSYGLDVEIDGVSVKLPDESKNVVQTERTKIIPVSATFNTLGTHKVTATITPNSEDWFKLNNVFYKSVFVVPKPKVLAVTEDTTSPLYKVATNLYEVKTLNSVPDDLSPYKAVIIDNKGAAQLSADSLRKYVGGGGGLVVVGGDASYDKGNYNNSPVEALLPIISRAAEYKGGQNIVLVLDSSGSTSQSYSQIVNIEPVSGNAEINAIAKNIVDKISPDTNVGVVAFGGSAAEKIPLAKMTRANKQMMIEKIIFAPGGGEVGTNLHEGLSASLDLLDLLGSVSGTKEVYVISDGQIDNNIYEKSLNVGNELRKQGINLHFMQVNVNIEADINSNYQKLALNLNAEFIPVPTSVRPVPKLEERPEGVPTPTPMATPEISYEFPLTALDTNHFITKYLNLTASVTGYNDVTPKLGSDELVATTKGKPILTTWGFGLGRVVAFTTDNGNPSSSDPSRPWASAVYSGENSRLISAMINWAIGDPRPKEGVVIQAEDIWGGTPGRVVVTSNTIPAVKLDGAALDLSRTGPTTYEASINLEKAGFHDLSGYGIAVNYPLEYRDVGFNEKLNSVIEANGGRVYDESEVEGLLLLDIKEKAVRTVQEPKSQKEPFLLAALILFLGEVIVRRLKDYRKERPVIEEAPARAAPAAPAAEPVAAE